MTEQNDKLMKTMNNVFLKRLKTAIDEGNVEFLKAHRDEYDINLKFLDEDNDSLLDYAISNPNNNIYKFFIDEGASLRNVNKHGENIIHNIVYSGCATRIVYILEKQNLDVNHQSDDGTTPLLLSVLLKDFDVFKTLIRLGADVNVADENNNLPIHMACMFGLTEMVNILIEKGSDLFKKTSHGNLPLALAVNENHIEIVKILYNVMYVNEKN